MHVRWKDLRARRALRSIDEVVLPSQCVTSNQSCVSTYDLFSTWFCVLFNEKQDAMEAQDLGNNSLEVFEFVCKFQTRIKPI